MRDVTRRGDPRFGCPECGGERIEVSMLVPFHYEVATWHDDGTPADLSDRREIDVDAKPDDPPYWCRDCHQAFQRPVRLDVDPDADAEVQP